MEEAPAYVGETVSVEVAVKNEDNRPLNLALTVMLQPTEDDDDCEIS
jgi:hypothetical protein